MSTYIFIIGKDPDLSLAELEARFPNPEDVFVGNGFVFLELASPIGQKEFDSLGGQIKMGEVFAKVKKDELVATIADRMADRHDSGKLNYGVSVYGWPATAGRPERNLRPLLLDLKKEFKRRQVSSRFANQEFQNLSAAQHKGLSGGAEVLVCKDGEDFYLAEVTAVQNIDAYSKRDYDKPFRNMKVGMLPPKLAQIMINLAGDVSTIWDPFCGGGGLVVEGLLMGHPMLGSDINEQTLQGAQRNIDWLKAESGVKREAELFVHDATGPLPKRKFDAIVCEGYLGPPQSRLKSEKELYSVVKELTDLYRKFFNSFKAANFRGPIVVALPYYKVREGELNLDEVIREIKKMNFKKELDLKYARKDQLVGRHILRFRLS